MKEKEAKLREQITENFPTYQNDEAALELAAQALEEYEKHGIKGYEDIVARFLRDGRLEYEGFPVKDAHALALLLQTFRNVNFETFRMVYMKGDTIAAMTGVESRMPSLTFTTQESNLAKEAYHIRRRMQRLEADGFYMVHNHPTGRVGPSVDDKFTTIRYARNFPGFRGHIILDHTQYAVLNQNGELSGIFEIPDSFQNPLFYETDTFVIGTTIRSSDELASFSDHLNPAPARSVLVFADANGKVRTFEEIENKVILHDKNFSGYLRNQMMRNGCPHALLATQSEEVYDHSLQFVRQHYLLDSVYVDAIGMESGFSWLKAQETEDEDEFLWAGLDSTRLQRRANNSGKMPPLLLREEVIPYGFEQEERKSMNMTAEEFLMQEELLTEERDAYGYTYDEMMPLSKKGALALFEYGAPIFLLYEDNTESEVFDRKQISEHDGIFGIEAADWAAMKGRIFAVETSANPMQDEYLQEKESPSEEEIEKKYLEILREADEKEMKTQVFSYSNDWDNVEVSMRLTETIKGCFWKTYDDGSGSLRRLQTDSVILRYHLHPVDSGYDEYEDANGWHSFERGEDIRLALEKLLVSGNISPLDHGAKDFALRSKEAARMFIDMDGTLAEFRVVDTMETLYEQGYFSQLLPHQQVVDGIKQFMKENPDTEVFILSSVLTDSPYAQEEKNAWLDRYLPEISAENRIFVPCGSTKNEFVPSGVRKNDVLLDDYSKNLHEWQGKALKLMNGINGTKGSFQGEKISAKMPAAEFAQSLTFFCEGREMNDRAVENKEIEKKDPVQGGYGKTQTVFQMMNGHLASNPEAAVEKKDYGMQDVCKAELIYPVSKTESKILKLTATQDAAQALSKYHVGDSITFVGIPTEDGYKICRMDEDGTVFAKQQKMLYDFTMRGEIPESDRKRDLALSDIKEGFKNLSYEEKFKLVLEEEVDCHDNEALKEELWEIFRDEDFYLGFFGKDEVKELTKRRDRFLEIQADMDKDGGLEL